MTNSQQQSINQFSTRIDEACDALEAAWQHGETPDWRDFIAGNSTEELQLCCADLIAVDMEWRQKAELPVRAEDYLEHIPGEVPPAVLASIIGHEFELQQRRGDKVGPEGYLERFPELSDAISTMFQKGASTSNQKSNSSLSRKRMKPTADELSERLADSGIMDAAQVESFRQATGLTSANVSGETLAKQLVKKGKLTKFQAQLAYNDKTKNLVMGSYVILEKLGEGGMGQVYKARHKRMNREVALKVLAPQFVKNEGALQRFHREVEAAARLNHANIVTAHDADVAHGTHYLVMELVAGDDLAELVKKSGPLSVTKTVDCILQAARGLAYAHGKNVIHRDIKPSNLLLSNDGTVKILDMGLARFDETGNENVAGAALTGTGTLMGTVDYMAPEQAIDSKAADHRADIYSLGCTLYCLLTGQPMYGEDTVMKRVMAHQNAAIPQLPVDDEELQTLLERMVAKKAEDRIAPTEEVVAALEAWQNTHVGRATQPIESAAVDIAIAPDGDGSSDVPKANDQHESELQSTETVLKPPSQADADTPSDSSAFEATIVPLQRVTEAVLSIDDTRGKSKAGPSVDRKLIGGAFAAVVLLIGLVAFWPNRDSDPENKAGADTGAPQSSANDSVPDETAVIAASPTGPNRVEDENSNATESTIRVRHFRKDVDGVPELLGQIGDHGKTVKVNDFIRLNFETKEDRYISVIAFNTDGTVQLCFPEDESQPSAMTRQVEFPSEPDVYFGLTEGPGQHAFLVLTSKQPLPNFSEMRSQLEAAGWKKNTNGGVWQFDGKQVSQLFAPRVDRGTLQRMTSDEFRTLCLTVEKQLLDCTVTGFAFPVE